MSLLYLKFSTIFCQEKVSTYIQFCVWASSLHTNVPKSSTAQLFQIHHRTPAGSPTASFQIFSMLYQSMINSSLSNLFCTWLWFLFSVAFHIFWMTVNVLYHWKHLKTGDLKVTGKVTLFSYTINEHHVYSPNNILINVITTYSRKNLNSYVTYRLILRCYRLKTKSSFK